MTSALSTPAFPPTTPTLTLELVGGRKADKGSLTASLLLAEAGVVAVGGARVAAVREARVATAGSEATARGAVTVLVCFRWLPTAAAARQG